MQSVANQVQGVYGLLCNVFCRKRQIYIIFLFNKLIICDFYKNGWFYKY